MTRIDDTRPRPPTPPSGRSAGTTTRRVRILAVLLALAVTVLGACADDAEPAAAEPEPEEVVLEPAGSTGQDPFAESVAIDETADFPDAVAAAARDTIGGLDDDPATGGLTTTGDTPGLYGGSRDEAVCDVPALTEFLSDPANRSQAEAFAGVLGITVADLGGGFLDALSPVALVADVLVTNHGFRDGEAVPFASVLQAGTAVLVDATGVPRVRCSCGNPLGPPPAAIDLAATTGDPWTGYQARTTTTITAAPEVIPELTVIDLANGNTYQQPPGPPAPPPPTTTTAPPPPPTTAPPPPPTDPPPPEPEATTIEAAVEGYYRGQLLGRCEGVPGSVDGLCWVEVRRDGDEAVAGVGYPASEIISYHRLSEGPGGWAIVETYNLADELPDPNIPDWVDG